MFRYKQVGEVSDDDVYHSVPPAETETYLSRARAAEREAERGGISATSASPAEYTLYKRRWLVVAILAFVNISSAMAWITFAPVANYAADYLDTNDANVNWLSSIYMVTVPFGFVAVWIMDTYGLAPVIILGAVCNTLGLVVRYLAVLSVFDGGYRYAVVLAGQGVASLAQPCFLFTPTKLAATWFPEGQRTVANTIGSTSNPLGILLGLLLSSQLCNDAQDVEFLLLLYMIPGVVSGVLAVAVMAYCKNAPPTPPSASAAAHHETFFTGLKKLIRIKAFWVLFFVFGAGMGVFNVLISIIEEVLCPHNYSDDFAGLCGGLMIGGGIVGAFLSGFYVDRTKKFALVAKVCFAMAAICCICLSVITRYRDLSVPIAVVSAVLGLFGFAQFSVSLELGVEATYPIAEGTSAGFLIISGQVQGFLLMEAAEWLSQPLSASEQLSNSCGAGGSQLTNSSSVPAAAWWAGPTIETSTPAPTSPEAGDMSRSMLFFGGYAALAACIYILAFHTKYKRMRAEHCNAADHILNFNRRNHGNQQPSVIF